MRALHHFTVATTRTLPGTHDPRVLECWSVHAPRLALDYEPLLNALIAISALHMIRLAVKNNNNNNNKPVIDPGLLACRATYLDAALRTHREGLDRPSPQTVDAACFTSCLVLIDAFAMLQEGRNDGGGGGGGPSLSGGGHHHHQQPYEPPVRWLRIAQASRYVFQTLYPMVRANPDSTFMDIIGTASADMYTPSALFSQPNAQRLPHAVLQGCLDAAGHPDVLDAYRKTSGCIGSILAAVEAGVPTMALCRRIMTFACFVPARYSDLVEEGRPHALVILAHFFALSVRARELWWVGDMPHREVYAIRDQLPSSLQYLMDVPLQSLQEAG